MAKQKVSKKVICTGKNISLFLFSLDKFLSRTTELYRIARMLSVAQDEMKKIEEKAQIINKAISEKYKDVDKLENAEEKAVKEKERDDEMQKQVDLLNSESIELEFDDNDFEFYCELLKAHGDIFHFEVDDIQEVEENGVRVKKTVKVKKVALNEAQELFKLCQIL